ncbi:MAG: UPF0182 family protein [Thermodesulfobacteriota bacterium]
MSRLKRWIIILTASFLTLGVLYVLLALVFTDFLVDVWWFQSLGYGSYFWQRLLYRYLVFASFTLLFFLVMFLNFWGATRFLGRVPSVEAKPASGLRRWYRRLLEYFRQRSLKFCLLFSLVVAVFVAFPLYVHWEDALLYVFAPAAGLRDPVYGKDVSYYLFSLPIYQLLLRELLVAAGFMFLGTALLYWRESRLLASQGLQLPWGAKVHLSVLAGFIFLIGAWFFILQRHNLVYDASHVPLFFGPGFTQMRVILPLIWLAIVLLLIVAGSFIYFMHTSKGMKILIFAATLFFLALGVLYSPVLPNLVQKYIVAPNEIVRERPFIANNIRATLAAYDLSEVETRNYLISDMPWDVRSPKLQATLRNIPVWEAEVLDDVFRQLQALRTYYDFNAVNVDRYTVGRVYQQVFLSARELNLQKLPPAAQNWVNERLKYTHGNGAVMVPAAQQGDAPMTWFLRDIPPRSSFGLQIEQPALYYGVGQYAPVIAPNKSREIGYPLNGSNVMVDYNGTGGVPVASFFRKLIFAVYFKERDIFFTTQTNSKSRMQFRRNIVERIKTLTPFFLLDKDPYIVATPQKFYWIQDAYVVSNRYPCSQPYSDQVNYIRNSVKIVVDAYNGTVDFYLADPRDPIIRAYSRIYPGLFKELDQMPAELKDHLRYPKDIFDIQMSIFTKYHQTDPEVFYKQEDVWEFPTIASQGKSTRIEPNYLTLNLLDKNRDEFILFTSMLPKGRTNLRSMVVAGCDQPNYGKIVVFSFPRGTLVYGPQQVDAFINQDTSISQNFTLWNQMGSRVVRGKMIIQPIGEAIVYVQPVYLAATEGIGIPQLKRLILCKGETVVMEPSLEQGLEALNARMRGTPARPAGLAPPSP